MKLIIDIPDQEYEDIQAYNINMDGIDVVCESILHGTPISDNATPIAVLEKIKGYVDHIRNTGMGKKKSLEFIEKFIEGLKAESEG